MVGEDYASRVRATLRQFWKPGQKLAVTDTYAVDPTLGVECELCGWPRTGKSPDAPGLKRVFVLMNEDTGRVLRIGSRCVENFRRYVQTSDPNARIAGIQEAPSKARSQTAGESFPYLQLVPMQAWVPARGEDFEREDFDEEYGVAYVSEELCEDEEDYEWLQEEEELYWSEEELHYYIGEDDYADVVNAALGLKRRWFPSPVEEEVLKRLAEAEGLDDMDW